MKTLQLPTLLVAAMLSTVVCFAQGVIGGNQNGFGPGGYLPQPVPVSAAGRQMQATLTVSGFEFNIISSALGTNLIVDPTSPVIVPLAAKTMKPGSTNAAKLGFTATFTLANNTPAAHVFEFPWAYWATNKIVFTIYDTNDVPLWSSVQLPVDMPPLAAPVDLALTPHAKWTQKVFIPLNPNAALLPDGYYRLEASLSATPVFSANASFQVKNLVASPVPL